MIIQNVIGTSLFKKEGIWLIKVQLVQLLMSVQLRIDTDPLLFIRYLPPQQQQQTQQLTPHHPLVPLRGQRDEESHPDRRRRAQKEPAVP